MLDRIDIQVEVPAVKYKDLASDLTGEPSSSIRQRVQGARQIQRERFADSQIHCNADMEPRQLRQFCQVQDAAQELLRVAITQLGLSARAYDRVLKVARTIADLTQGPAIEAEHISEAIQYRSLDRSFWNR